MVYGDYCAPMGKFIFGVGTFVILLFFFSCSNSQNTQGISSDYDTTLRVQFQSRFKSVDWTQELEADLLPQRKALKEQISASQSLQTPDVASLVKDSSLQRVYPSIPDFGSLDISSLPMGARNQVNSFCQTVLDLFQDRQKSGLYSLLVSKMVAGRNYMISIFLYDTSSYPITTKFFLGLPHLQDDVWEVPVLFRGESGNWIMSIYLVQEDETWKIEQIRYGDFVYE